MTNLCSSLSLSLVALGVLGAMGCGYHMECACDCQKGCEPIGGTAGSGGTGGATGGQGGTGALGGQGGGGAGHGGQGGAGGQAPLWEAPQCDLVSGTPAVTFSKDTGATFAPVTGQLPDVAYTAGLAVLRAPGHLLAETSGDVLRSTDGGCTWTKIGDAGATITRLVAAGEDGAYGFSPNGSHLYRVDGSTVSMLPVPVGVADIRGLGVDRADPEHIRVGDQEGGIFDSIDGGVTFSKIGVSAPDGCFNTVAFDPSDLDHVLCGTLSQGAFVTFDGGAGWTQADVPAPANAFSFAVSPVDGKRVWLRAIYLLDFPDEKQGLLVSSDGGETFQLTLEDGGPEGFHTTNGPAMTADVFDADVLYVTEAVDLYRVDLGQSTLEKLDPHIAYLAESIAVAPSDPPILYVGLTQEIVQ